MFVGSGSRDAEDALQIACFISNYAWQEDVSGAIRRIDDGIISRYENSVRDRSVSLQNPDISFGLTARSRVGSDLNVVHGGPDATLAAIRAVVKELLHAVSNGVEVNSSRGSRRLRNTDGVVVIIGNKASELIAARHRRRQIPAVHECWSWSGGTPVNGPLLYALRVIRICQVRSAVFGRLNHVGKHFSVGGNWRSRVRIVGRNPTTALVIGGQRVSDSAGRCLRIIDPGI